MGLVQNGPNSPLIYLFVSGKADGPEPGSLVLSQVSRMLSLGFRIPAQVMLFDDCFLACWLLQGCHSGFQSTALDLVA